MERKFDEKIREFRKKKINFIRQSSHKKKRLGNKWRRPKGLQSKLRLKRAGHRKKVSVGYRSPKTMRNLHVSGMKNVLVRNEDDVKKVDTKQEVVTIAKVGLRKRVAIVKEAVKKSIKILNIGDPNKFLEKIEKDFAKRKQEKKEKLEKKKKETKPKKKEKLEEKVDEEKDKKEKDKVLTKKV